MAEAFFLSGLASNACIHAQSVVVSSEDAIFPKANLQSGKPWEPFRFGTLDVNPYIAFDNNFVVNPSFEVDADGVSPPTNWNIPTGGGTPDVSTTQFNEGAKALRLNAANEAAHQDRPVRPGGTYRVSVALYGDGTNAVNAYLMDLITGKWLLSNSTWSTTKTAWATKTTTGWATTAITFTFEAPLAGHVGPGMMRLLFERPGSVAAAAYVDSVYVWPKVTVAALAFDTMPTSFSYIVQSDDNVGFSSATTAGTFPARRFRKYVTFAGPATPERFWRFVATGTAYDLFRPWIGQPILGERQVMTRNPARDFKFIRTMPTQGTDENPSRESEASRNALQLSWRTSTAGLDEHMNHMLAACYYGVEPLLLVPRDDREYMVYGRGKNLSQISQVEVAEGVFEYEVTVVDDKYPVETT